MLKDSAQNLSVTKAQADAINNAAINTRETQLDALINKFGGDPAKLTNAQRAVLMDVFYQYGNGSKKVINAVKNLVNGGDNTVLLKDVTSPQYGARSKNDKALLFPKGDPMTSKVVDGVGAAKRFVPRRDPLILDLNSNGIETVAPNLNNPILFDHEGNGIKTGTGWVAPSDGFLVLDRNGNGTIDDGTELFGDSTPIFDAEGNVTGKAADGFDALAQQDTNHDGIVNSQDANFDKLRVWQDLNQNAISDAGELKTLAELGITGINVGKTEHSQILPNGNEIADLGTFTRSDGTSGSAGVSSRLADVNLASDTFHRSFSDVIPTTAQTVNLPVMQGSGMVRDLREAASLTTAEGSTLATALAQFAAM